MQEIERRYTKSIRDMLLVGCLLGSLNWLVTRGDFGWMGLNPTPWLLLPALLGGRYGVGPGLLAGLCAAISVAVVQSSAHNTTAHAFTQQHSWYFTALLLMGGLAGEFRRLTQAKHHDLRINHRRLTDHASRLDAELELARETRQELEQHLAFVNAPITGLDDDLRKLIMKPREEMLEGLLAVLHQHTGMISAAIYRQEGSRLRRLAVIHPTRPLAEVLVWNQIPLVAKAVDEQLIASVANALEATPAHPFLAAIPWVGMDGRGVLLVQDMPLETFDWAHLSTAHLILNWTFALSRYRADFNETGGAPQPLEPEDFMALVGQALGAEHTHQLPSVLLRADFIAKADAESMAIERKLLQMLPPIALSTRLPKLGSLMVLLPFSGDTEAQVLGRDLAKAGPPLRVSHYLVSGPAKLEELWAHATLP